jgi:hypothetical protein
VKYKSNTLFRIITIKCNYFKNIFLLYLWQMATQGNNIKKAMIEALKKTFGRVSQAAEIVGINRCTHYKWLESDPEYKEMVEEINEASIDFVELKLFEKITGVTVQNGINNDGEPMIYTQPPSDTAIIFYLKTKGKKRGYVERQEIDHSGSGIPIQINWPDGD